VADLGRVEWSSARCGWLAAARQMGDVQAAAAAAEPTVVFSNPAQGSSEEEGEEPVSGEEEDPVRGAELRFTNPLREPEVGDGASSPSSPSSPLSPQFEQDAVPLSALVQAERPARSTRNEAAYLILTLGIAVLLPVYVLLALFAVGMLYLVPSPMSSLAMLVLVAVPAVLAIGRSGARKESESKLQLFSFLMMLVISMQLSCAVVFLIDDGSLADAFIDNAAVTAAEMCSSGTMETLSAVLPVATICRCSGDGSYSGTMASCFRAESGDGAGGAGGGGGAKATIAAVIFSTLAAELVLACLAWGMIVDLDVVETKMASKRQGGAPTGKLRGTVVCGLNLRSEAQNTEYAKSENYRPPAQEISSRYAVVSMRSADLSDGDPHKLQRTQTDPCGRRLVTCVASRVRSRGRLEHVRVEQDNRDRDIRRRTRRFYARWHCVGRDERHVPASVRVPDGR
jgi:hypothetical protein